MQDQNTRRQRVFFVATLTLATLTFLINRHRKCRKNNKKLITDIVAPTEPRKMRVISDKGFEMYKNQFRPGPNDVIICTADKTGTTWLQAICHFLRGGTADFEDICQVVPWHVFAHDLDFNIMDQGGYRPRAFKSHQLISAEKRGCKYITSIRDPIRRLMSEVAFHNRKKGTNNTVDESWRRQNLKGRKEFQDSCRHFVEAYKLRDHPQVLVVCYEHLVKDARRMLATIARFLGIQHPSEELLERTLKATSKAQMLIDRSKYNEIWETTRYAEVGRGALGQKWIPAAKVVGVVHKEPSSETRADIISATNEYFMETIGVRNYAELQTHISASFSKRTQEFHLQEDF